MKKDPWYLWLGFSLGLLCAVVWRGLELCMKFGISLWIGGISSEEVLWFLPYIAVVLTVLFGGLLLYRHAPKGKGVVIALAGLVIVATLAIGYGRSLFWSIDGYETYISPDGEHTIVVKKESWLMGSWGSVFEVDSPFTMRQLCRYSNGDWVNPEVDIGWYEDYFIISYEKEVGGGAETEYYLK